MEEFEIAEPVLARLEDLFSSPKFTTQIGNFMGEHAGNVEAANQNEEQPSLNNEIFRGYTHMVEHQIEMFLKEENLNVEEVFEACRRVKEQGDAAWLTCVDYLLAATDYTRFLQLAADFQSMEQWEPAEGEAVLLEDYNSECIEDNDA
mmetsp:Transcript_30540/g.42288  ORF Transcript_30540/g.42288 Transcript_30540/m.42288 type:complete len:148 (+) Transcript_30540:102-545(+)|eukprot:CAMPEP_0196589064 /NCGR_PEP_ID=MMETSP1081-20130531/62601_1 /TAXON_ID=36882 /ORGANISM="Pyramimonas amylifera, Strain CCMP720" /LENGTH=147 /DNA_ID=CAMNT_0041911775 /DNA_START=97 /DNA_END=540 /DNA_ORIENTATION=+